MSTHQASSAELGLDPVSGPPIDRIRISPDRQQVLGRVSECDVVLEHTRLSRRHALIERRDAGWFVTDLGSHNGTYVNSIRIEDNEPVALGDQDVLGLPPWAFLVTVGDGDEDAATDHPAEPPPEDPPGPATYATRASIFLRLRDTNTEQRELSWEEFSSRYGRVIVGFARNAGLPAQDAEDILQDVLFGFFRVSGDFEYDPAKGRFRGYLKRVTLNAIRARHRRRRPEVHPEVEALPADPATVNKLWSHEWSKNALEHALDDVSPRFERETYQAFELYGRRGVPLAAVAEQLGMSPEAVRQAKCRVARAVREAMERIRLAED